MAAMLPPVAAAVAIIVPRRDLACRRSGHGHKRKAHVMGLILLILIVILLFGGGGYYGYRSGYYGGAHYGGGLGLVVLSRAVPAVRCDSRRQLLLAERGGGPYFMPPWLSRHYARAHGAGCGRSRPRRAVASVVQVEPCYPGAVPPAILPLIERPDDPIVLQFIPDPAGTHAFAALGCRSDCRRPGRPSRARGYGIPIGHCSSRC